MPSCCAAARAARATAHAWTTACARATAHKSIIIQKSSAQRDQGIVFSLNDVVIYSDANSSVTVTGTVSIRPHIDFDAGISASLIPHIKLGLGAGGGVSLDLKATGQASFT